MYLQNIYEDVKDGLHFNKLRVDELLYVEYTCPITEKEIGIWSQCDYVVHILSGKKTWKTQDAEWDATKGDTLYVKKGAYIIEQSFDHDFCMIGFFINDAFVRNLLEELQGKIPINRNAKYHEFSIKKIEHEPTLDGFINSMFPFFSSNVNPSASLLELKFKELIINLLSSDENAELSAYLQTMADGDNSIHAIMENNFMYSHTIEEFSRMCNRSLSKFKRDFKELFHTSPGKWIVNRRLEYACELIIRTNESISRIAYSSGFEDISHFSYVFKIKYGKSPVSYRQSNSKLVA